MCETGRRIRAEEGGRGRKRAKAGDQSTKVEWISDAVEVGRLREFEWKIERAVGSLTSRPESWKAWCELLSFISPMRQLSPLAQGDYIRATLLCKSASVSYRSSLVQGSGSNLLWKQAAITPAFLKLCCLEPSRTSIATPHPLIQI